MHRQGKQSQIYGIEILQMSICTDKASKVKCRTEILQMSICRHAETKVKFIELK